jgi:hypothetical protein
MRITYFLALVSSIALGAVGCSSSDSDQPAPGDSDSGTVDSASDAPTADGATADSSTADSATTDSSALDSSTSDSSVADSSPDDAAQDTSNSKDFAIRKPQEHKLTCPIVSAPDAGSSQASLSDTDWICTFKYDGKEGQIYIQSTPTQCEYGYGPMPTVFSHPVQQIKLNGSVYPLTNASYDYGGNHQNNFMEFDYEGKHFKYYHSSFGWGWRCCQNMDCTIVSDATSKTVILDGCTKDRALPIVCSQIKADGSFDPLTDGFAHCPGDPNYP